MPSSSFSRAGESDSAPRTHIDAAPRPTAALRQRAALRPKQGGAERVPAQHCGSSATRQRGHRRNGAARAARSGHVQRRERRPAPSRLLFLGLEHALHRVRLARPGLPIGEDRACGQGGTHATPMPHHVMSTLRHATSAKRRATSTSRRAMAMPRHATLRASSVRRREGRARITAHAGGTV